MQRGSLSWRWKSRWHEDRKRRDPVIRSPEINSRRLLWRPENAARHWIATIRWKGWKRRGSLVRSSCIRINNELSKRGPERFSFFQTVNKPDKRWISGGGGGGLKSGRYKSAGISSPVDQLEGNGRDKRTFVLAGCVCLFFSITEKKGLRKGGTVFRVLDRRTSSLCSIFLYLCPTQSADRGKRIRKGWSLFDNARQMCFPDTLRKKVWLDQRNELERCNLVIVSLKQVCVSSQISRVSSV